MSTLIIRASPRLIDLRSPEGVRRARRDAVARKDIGIRPSHTLNASPCTLGSRQY